MLHVFEPASDARGTGCFQRSPAVPVTCAMAAGILVDRIWTIPFSIWWMATLAAVVTSAVCLRLGLRSNVSVPAAADLPDPGGIVASLALELRVRRRDRGVGDRSRENRSHFREGVAGSADLEGTNRRRSFLAVHGPHDHIDGVSAIDRGVWRSDPCFRTNAIVDHGSHGGAGGRGPG